MQKTLAAPEKEATQPMAKSEETICVGIDLGTSRSSISASNGERHVVDSYVGWPVDMVARKVIKKQVVIGREALENRSMLDLRRPLENGVIKDGSERDANAVQELLRHLVSLIGNNNGKQQKLRAVVGVPAEAMQTSRLRVRTALDGIADSVMLVSEPFAVAYGTEALLHAMVIDIGAGTTDICVMQGRYPTEEDQRTLHLAGDSIDQRLFKSLQEHHPQAQFSIHTVRTWKEQWSFVGTPKRRVVVTTAADGKPVELDITEDMRTACETIVSPIAEAVQDLVARVEPEYQQKVLNNIVLTGGGSQIDGLADALKSALAELGKAQITLAQDPVFAGSDGGLAIACDASDGDWEKLSL
jgi:rod shape-determining protein MreB